MLRHARPLWAFPFGALLLAPTLALGALDPTDVIQIQATVSLLRDNNLFRLPEVDPRLFGINPDNKSDTVLIKGVGLKVDKLLSRQRLVADINLNEQTYDKNTNLDFFGGDARLAWLWRVGNHWSGEATYRKQRRLGGFSDFRQAVQDLIDTDTYSFSGGYDFHPRWRIGVELSEQESRHSAVTRTDLDTNAHVIGTELRYRTPSQNSVGMQVRRTDRSFPNRTAIGLVTLDNGHQETRVSAVATWQLTGNLKLDGQLGKTDVQHDQLAQRDFSGVTWRAAASLTPTAKLRLNLNTAREIRLYEDIATSFILVNSVGLSPAYALTPKVLIQSDLSYEKREYRGDPGFVIVNVNREDNVRLGRIAVTYTPIRNVDLTLSYEASDRRSNVFLSSYDYRSWLGTIRVGF